MPKRSFDFGVLLIFVYLISYAIFGLALTRASIPFELALALMVIGIAVLCLAEEWEYHGIYYQVMIPALLIMWATTLCI